MTRKAVNSPTENFAVIVSILIIFLAPFFYIDSNILRILYLGVLAAIAGLIIFNANLRELFFEQATRLLIALIIVVIIVVIIGGLFYMMSNIKENQG